jgi:Tfp pilus assembly protein PilF
VTRRPSRSLAALALSLPLALGLAACGSGGSDTSAPSASASALTPVDTLINSGLRSLQAGDTDVASASFKAALEIDPKNVFANYNLGYIAQMAGQSKQALSYYDAALATDKTFAAALYNKAYLTETTDLDAAIALYRRALDTAPNNADTHMRLGFALLHQGKKSEGEKELAAGIKLDPTMKNVTAPTYDN